MSCQANAENSDEWQLVDGGSAGRGWVPTAFVTTVFLRHGLVGSYTSAIDISEEKGELSDIIILDECQQRCRVARRQLLPFP